MEFRNLHLSAFSEVNKVHVSAELEHLVAVNRRVYPILVMVSVLLGVIGEVLDRVGLRVFGWVGGKRGKRGDVTSLRSSANESQYIIISTHGRFLNIQ